MDDITSNVTKETNPKITDGYSQLAEKMDQVKNQVARMERKYDELYQAVKEKDMTKASTQGQDSLSEQQQQQQQQPQELKAHRDNMLSQSQPKQSTKTADESSGTKEEASRAPQPSSPTTDMDIEKMEDNPFV